MSELHAGHLTSFFTMLYLPEKVPDFLVLFDDNRYILQSRRSSHRAGQPWLPGRRLSSRRMRTRVPLLFHELKERDLLFISL